MTLGNRERDMKCRDKKEGRYGHQTKENTLKQVAGGLGMDFRAHNIIGSVE